MLKAASLHCRDHWEMLFRYVIPGCCEDHTKCISTLCGQNAVIREI